MSYFYIAYQQQLMGVKIREKCRLEWYFEDVVKISIVSNTASNGHELEWMWIQLNKPPIWTRKLDGSNRSRTSWDNRHSVRRNSPPADLAVHFTDVRANPAAFGMVPEAVSSDGRNIHMAIQPLRKTWEAHLSFPVHLRLFPNYDRTVVEQLRAQGAPTLAPYADEVWYKTADLALCENCDDETTGATAHCIDCHQDLCAACDPVLHKSRAKSQHKVLTLASFSDATLAQRKQISPCHCEHERNMPCPCEKLRLFCLKECTCRFHNAFNHGPQDELNQEQVPLPVAGAAPLLQPSVTRPMRFGKHRSGGSATRTKRPREDTSLRNFIKQGEIDEDEDLADYEEDEEMDEDD